MYDKTGRFQDGCLENNSEYTSQSKFSILFLLCTSQYDRLIFINTVQCQVG